MKKVSCLGTPYPSSVKNASFNQVVFPPSDVPALTLYKYVDGNALRQILRKGTLKATFREDSNDPYELLPCGENPQTSSANNELGFICFSSLNDSPSLWGNYAAKYTGACLEFNIPFFFYESLSKRDKSPCNYLWPTSSMLSFCLGVDVYFVSCEYSSSIKIDLHGGGVIVKCLYSNKRVELGALPDFTGLPDESFIRQAAEVILPLAVKDIGWESENEYRAIFRRECCIEESGKYFVSDYMRYLNRIIITEKAEVMGKEIEELLIKTPNIKPDVKVVQARFSNSDFRLVIP